MDVVFGKLRDRGRVTAEQFDEVVVVEGLPARDYVRLRALAEGAGLLGSANLDGDAATGEVDDAEEVNDTDDDRPWDGDTFKHFMKKTSHRILTAEEEIVLGRVVEKGRLAQQALDEQPWLSIAARRQFRKQVEAGRHAADEFALHNVRLVVSIATKTRKSLGSAMDLQDLIQEGYIGLAHAIQKWDHRKGFKLSTYASWWIRQSLGRAIEKQARTIRLPSDLTHEVRQLARARRQLEADGKTCTRAALALHLGWEQKKVDRISNLPTMAVSVDRQLERGGSWSPLTSRRGDVEGSFDSSFQQKAVTDLLASLNPRERVVLIGRYGLAVDDKLSFREIGEQLGVTAEAARRMHERLLLKLRDQPGDFQDAYAGRSPRSAQTEQEQLETER